MPQLFKLFFFSIYVILILQLADADEEKTSNKSNESNGQAGEEYKAPFLINVEKITNSNPIREAKKHLNNFSRDFESNLNTESKKHVNDGESIIPNFVKDNLILPGKAVAQTSFNAVSQPIGHILSSIKHTYEDELTKSKQIAEKPVSFLKASKNIVENTLGNMFGKASSIWSWDKNDKGQTSAEESEKEDQ